MYQSLYNMRKEVGFPRKREELTSLKGLHFYLQSDGVKPTEHSSPGNIWFCPSDIFSEAFQHNLCIIILA